jgi:serine/threonine protein kinase/Tol biopolymer transport system component
MNPERWHQLKPLIESALDRAPQERAAYLDKICAGDEALRRELDAFLAAHKEGDRLTKRPAIEVTAPLPAAASTEPLVNRLINHYQILKWLGAGGMGEVYLAHDNHLGRKVALKLLPREFTGDETRMRRFQQEARAASALNHPNIITIFDIGQSDQLHFIATEYIQGQTLRQLLSASPLATRLALDVALQVTSALAAAHDAGIIHRDIKPENLMLRPDGYVKVLDFGLAKLLERKSQASDSEVSTLINLDTDPGVVMGTASYMSPEQARGLPVDARTDIFSLGVVLYEMITSHLPFTGKTNSDVIAAILNKEAPGLARYAPDAPAKLQWIVSKALRKEKEERYQTAREMWSDLKEVKDDLELKSKLERSAPPEVSGWGTHLQLAQASGEQVTVDTASKPALQTDDAGTLKTSNAHLILDEFKRHKIGAAVIALTIFLFVAGVGYGLYRFTNRTQLEPPRLIKMTMLTNSGKADLATISPDGKYIAYMLLEGEKRSLWVKHIATASETQIVLPSPYIGGVTFSPDGNYVYYTMVETVGVSAIGTLYQIPVLGGVAKKLLMDIDSAITFSPDGKQFAFIRGFPNQGEEGLMVANADASHLRQRATRKLPDGFCSAGYGQYLPPAWSPDGKTIACAVNNFHLGETYQSIIGIQVGDESQAPLSSQRWDGVSGLVWLADNKGLLITAQEAQKSEQGTQIWQIAYPDGSAQKITSDSNWYVNLSLTADSKILVTSRNDWLSSIWVAPEGDASRAKPISSGKYDGEIGLDWTPDGRIVYTTTGTVRGELWIMQADGSGRKQLAKTGYQPKVSSDGRYVVFQPMSRDGTGIWKMEIESGEVKHLNDNPASYTHALSPDGQWVVFFSQESGKNNIWKMPVEGGEPTLLVSKDTRVGFLSISPDGKLLAYSYQEGTPSAPQWKIAFIHFAAGDEVKTLDFPQWLSPYKWMPDGRALACYSNYARDATNIWSLPINGGQPKPLTDFKSDRIFDFAWSPDKKNLAIVRGVVMSDIVLITDFK